MRLPIRATSLVVFFFSRLDRQWSRCARRLWFCRRVLAFEISMQLWVSQPDIALHVAAEESRIQEVHSFSGPNASRFLQGRICLGPSMKVSCTHICIVLHLLSSKSNFLDRLKPACLVISLVVYALYWCTRCIQIHWWWLVHVFSQVQCPSTVQFDQSQL